MIGVNSFAQARFAVVFYREKGLTGDQRELPLCRMLGRGYPKGARPDVGARSFLVLGLSEMEKRERRLRMCLPKGYQ